MKPCSELWSSRAIDLGDAADAVLLGLRREHDDLAGALDRGGDDRGERAGRARAGGALGGGEHAGAPVVLARRKVVGEDDDHGAAVAEVDAELLPARDEIPAVGDVAAEDSAQERALGGLGGALGRAQALDLGGDQRGDHAQQRGGRLLAGAPAQPQPADDVVADAQLVRRDARGVGHQRALVGARARGDREHAARAIDQDQGGIQRASRGAHDLGEPETALDRLRDGVERAEVRRGRHLAGRLGHHLKFRAAPGTAGGRTAGFALRANTRKGTRPPGPAFP